MSPSMGGRASGLRRQGAQRQRYPRLRAAVPGRLAAMARIRTVFADKGYDAEPHRDHCRQFGIEPQIQAWLAKWLRIGQAMLAS